MSERKVNLRFGIGDKVVSRKYGKGVVIDTNDEDHSFCYNVAFEDGTKAWYDGCGTVLADDAE